MKRLAFFSTIVFTILFCITACKRSKSPDTSEFAAYIFDYSQGMLHGNAPVYVTLTSDSPFAGEPGSEAEGKIIVFTPEMSGKTYWIDKRTLRFVPDKKWPHDTNIQATVFLNRLAEVPVEFHQFRFGLKTMPISFNLDNIRLETSSNGSESYVLRGDIVLSDKTDLDKADRLLRLETKGKRYPIRVMADAQNPLRLKFESDSIIRRSNGYELNLQWNGKAIGSIVKGNTTIFVPEKAAFVLMKTEVINEPEPTIKLWFSDITDSQQNLSGLIRLEAKEKTGAETEPEIRFERRNNCIIIYPLDELSGDFILHSEASLRNADGKNLGENLMQDIALGKIKPQVRFVGKGNILSGASKGMIRFQAVGLKAVDVHVIKVFENNMLQFLQWANLEAENNLKDVGRIVAKKQQLLAEDQPSLRTQWATYALDLNKIIEQDPGTLYRVLLTFKREYTLDDCNKNQEVTTMQSELDREELAKWEGSQYYDPSLIIPDNFDWNERDNPCSDSYYYYEHFASRNVISSNIGLMAMESNSVAKELLMVVTNLETASPLPGAKVELFDYQQQYIASGISDAQGMVRLHWNDVKPFFATARFANEKTYLKLDEGSALPYTRFDVEGKSLQQGMNAFLFSERGVYRPGDTLHFGMMLNTGNETLPEQYPVVLELYNARNQAVGKQTTVMTSNGLCRFSMPTHPDAQTGMWTATVKVGGASFSRRVRVETVKPNRLKINFDFGGKTLFPNDMNRNGSMVVQWLHGGKAPGYRFKLNVLAKAVPINFPKYSGFSFTDPTIYSGQTEKSELNGQLDSEGRWSGSLKLPIAQQTPGKFQMQWEANVFEPGGDFSVTSHQADFLPYTHYLGIAAPQAEKEGYLYTGSTLAYDLVQLDANGYPYGNDKVMVEVLKTDWSWWWSGSQSGQANYISSYDTERILEKEVQLSQGKGVFEWKPSNDQWGNYIIRVSHKKGGHSAGIVSYIDWPSSYSRSGRRADGGASLLPLSANKERYRIGEEAVISFVGPANGKALVSIEAGDKQQKCWWVNTIAGENHLSIPLLGLYSPNVYVHLTLLQPVGQSLNDLPVRTFGVINLRVEDPGARLLPQLQLPQETNSGQSFRITVSEKNNRPMDYFLAVVDEGLLDLTGFGTPDPYGWFNQKIALSLKSWDMFDYVLGSYGGRLEQILTIGGDAAMPDREKARQSRFKPVVRFIGPVSLKAGGKNTHLLNIDNYIGSVRVMVVAGSKKAYGSTEGTLNIRQPLMALATLPRLLRENDEIVMPVTVFSSLKEAHQANVTVETSGEISLTDLKSKQVNFNGEGEKTIRFGLKAGSKTGKGIVNIKVSSGNIHSAQKIELSIENPNDRVFQTEHYLLGVGQEKSLNPVFTGVENTRRASIEVSALPTANLERRLSQLLAYPYGCTEQIVSQAFAQLYLDQVNQIGQAQNQSRRINIEGTIRQLSERQLSSGGFTYWPGSAYYNEWVDVYAVHFLILAEQEGFAVPSIMMKNALKNQKQKATAWRSEYLGKKLTNDVVQAYRLFTLALTGNPLFNAMNRLREAEGISLQSAHLLAAAYQLAGQKEAARQLALGKYNYKNKDYDFAMDFGSPTRDKAIKAIVLITLGEPVLAFPLVKELSESLNSAEFMSTQTTAFALNAWQLYAKNNPLAGKLSFKIGGEKANDIIIKNAVYQEDIPLNSFPYRIKNTGEAPLYLSLTNSGIEASGPGTSLQKGVELQVNFTDDQGKTLDPQQITQGTSFNMHTTVSNFSGRDLNFLALSQLAAACWEILNDDFGEKSENGENVFDDRRDDRIIRYFDLKAGQSKTYTLHLLAAYEGSYLLPAQRCEAMYDNEVMTILPGKKVEVKSKLD